MKTITLCLCCFFINISVTAQEITMDQLMEIALEGDDKFLEVVKGQSYKRLDYDKGDEGYTGSKIGARKKHYGPKSTDGSAKINSIYFLVFQQKDMAIIYTDNEEHWNKEFFVKISNSDKYVRQKEQEGTSEFKDWVYQPVGKLGVQITFIKHPGNENGDYSIAVSKSHLIKN